jgi:hypothetical protein
MNCFETKKAIVIFACLFASNLVLADSFRCNNKVVKSGDNKYTVLAKCGLPVSSSILNSADNSNNLSKVEILIYQQASERLAKILRFEDDVLVSVEYETNVQL